MNRARRRRDIRKSLLAGLPWVIVAAVVGHGRQEHASAIYYLIAVPVCAGVITAFAVGSYAASRRARRAERGTSMELPSLKTGKSVA